MSEMISVESKEKQRSPEGYFSVSHLLHTIRVRSGEEVKSYYVAVLGGTKNGKPKFQAFGGGAKLTEEGIEYLKNEYGDRIRFREGEESDDARFYLELPEALSVSDPDVGSAFKNQTDAFMRTVLEPFLDPKSGRIEETVERELKEEFSEVLGEIDWDLDRVSYAGVVSPQQGSVTGSTRADGAIAYHRIFHLYDLELSEAQFAQLAASDKVRVLTDADIESVQDAARHGKTIAELPDGVLLAENVFPIMK